jgi:hypothetical protein
LGGFFFGADALSELYDDLKQNFALRRIIFDVASAPPGPEPSIWTMMILEFFGVGFMSYRRKDGTAFSNSSASMANARIVCEQAGNATACRPIVPRAIDFGDGPCDGAAAHVTAGFLGQWC